MTNSVRQLLPDVRSHMLRMHTSSVIDRQAVADVVSTHHPLLGDVACAQLVDLVLADLQGMGPLDPFLHDPDVTDMLVVGGKGVWIERGGELISVPIELSTEDIERLIERVVSPLGLHLDRASPMVDGRLPDGSRVHAVLPPVAVDGPCLTIRRFAARTIPLELMADAATALVLRRAVRERRNIVVSGGTGAGKTTLLNALAGEITTSERVITIEDTAELRLPLTHIVRLEARPANTEGVGEVSLRQLVRNALRMRPDRLIVGEVRGPEAFDMLQAMNTGHAGSMSTCHANSANAALRRLETMVLMADIDLPISAVREQIASSIEVVVHMERKGKSRRVTEVLELPC